MSALPEVMTWFYSAASLSRECRAIRWMRLSSETDYNAREHSTLKMKPVDRFAMDLGRIRFLDPMDATDELFYFEQDRSVRKDNTFQVLGTRYSHLRRLPPTHTQPLRQRPHAAPLEPKRSADNFRRK